jgi:4-hydroxyphenylpyruvate dioxygenase-like putative hemolysin
MIKRIDYLMIKTDDAAGAAQAWDAVLGLKGRGPWMIVGIRSFSLPIGGSFLELAEPEGDGAYGDWLRQQPEGMCLVGIEVDDLASAAAHLQAQGVNVSEPRGGVAAGLSFALVDAASAHGVPIALVQRLAEGEA